MYIISKASEIKKYAQRFSKKRSKIYTFCAPTYHKSYLPSTSHYWNELNKCLLIWLSIFYSKKYKKVRKVIRFYFADVYGFFKLMKSESRKFIHVEWFFQQFRYIFSCFLNNIIMGDVLCMKKNFKITRLIRQLGAKYY